MIFLHICCAILYLWKVHLWRKKSLTLFRLATRATASAALLIFLSQSGNEQVQSHDPFPRFFWRYCGSAHDHSCFFPVRVCHFPYAARGKSFPPVPSECQIWLFQRNHNCFIWKMKSDHLLCFYCADSHARQQSVHVQRRTRCTAWGIPQRFQRYLVEHVNASHRRLRWYLPDRNTCYLCFRKKTRF